MADRVRCDCGARWSEGPKRRSVPAPDSAVEGEPADRVAKPLIVQDEVPDRLRQLKALPSALAPTGLFGFGPWRSRPGRLDGVCGCPQLMGRDMTHSGRLARRVRRVTRSPAQVAGGPVRMAGRGPRHRPRHVAARPRPPQLDRSPRTFVVWTNALEMVEDVLGAVGRPEGKEAVVLVAEETTPTDRDEPGIADLRQDHGWIMRPSAVRDQRRCNEAASRR